MSKRMWVVVALFAVGLAFPAAGWMPATSNCVMPPCTHARARSLSGSAREHIAVVFRSNPLS